MTPDVNVVLLDFKNTKENEMVSENADGSYTIFINSRLSSNQQLEAYNHAMEHIRNADFEKTDVQIIEAAAHGLSVNNAEPSVPSKVFLDRMQAARKRRRQIRRRLKKYQDKMDFISQYGDSFALAEHEYLYGKDL